MAIAFDANLGSSSQNTSATTITLTTTAAAAVGARIVVNVFYRAASATAITMSGGGLTGWQLDQDIADNGNARRVATLSVAAPTGLASPTVLTATFAVAPTSGIITAASFTGMSGTVDASGSNGAGASGASWTVSTSAPTTSADALAWAASATSTSTVATDTPSNGVQVHDVTNTGLIASMCTVYEIETATGTKTIAGTRTGLTGSSYSVAGIVVYAPAVAPSYPTINQRVSMRPRR